MSASSLVTQLQKKDAGGYTHTVTVRQFAGRFRTELGEQGVHGRVLAVSSYEFYQGSYPQVSDDYLAGVAQIFRQLRQCHHR